MSSAAQKPSPASLRAFGPFGSLGVCHSTPYQPKESNPAGADAGGFFARRGSGFWFAAPGVVAFGVV